MNLWNSLRNWVSLFRNWNFNLKYTNFAFLILNKLLLLGQQILIFCQRQRYSQRVNYIWKIELASVLTPGK